jgi:hypothetical protein
MLNAAPSELLRRHSALLDADQNRRQDWERALRHFVARSRALERGRGSWHRRISKAMRGVGAETWWRYRARIEAGELWVAPGAKARRLQRLVLVSSSAVLELVARQDEDLRSLVSASRIAAAELRTATAQQLVAAVGVERVAAVLGLAPAVVRSLLRAHARSDWALATIV